MYVLNNCRYLQTDKAFTMYDEMMEKKLPVDLLTFNELIRAATFNQDTYETKWKQVVELFWRHSFVLVQD